MMKIFQKNLFFLSLIILVLISWFFWCQIESSSTISAIVAGLFLLLITAWLIPWYQDNYLNNPDLKIVDARDGQENLSLRKISTNNYQLHFALKNNGRLPIKSMFYWHIIIPVNFNPDYKKEKENTNSDGYVISPFPKDGQIMTKIDGWSSSSIYSKSRLANFHVFTFSCNSLELLPHTIYYYFSTEFGYSPKSVYKYDDIFTSSKGEDKLLEYFDSVKILPYKE